MFTVAPKEASTCRSKGPQGEWIERTCDYVIASHSLRGEIAQMEVMEDFESRPHNAVSFVVERNMEVQEWIEQKMRKALPGHNGGRLSGRSTDERDRQRAGSKKRNCLRSGCEYLKKWLRISRRRLARLKMSGQPLLGLLAN